MRSIRDDRSDRSPEARGRGGPEGSGSPAGRPDRGAAAARFRGSYGRVLGVGILVSVAAHFLLLSADPPVRMPSSGHHLQALEVVRLPPPVVIPPEVEVPERPEPVRRPSPPVVGPDPAEGPDEPAFIPHDVRPRLMNTAEVRDFLLGFYPPTLRAVGVEGEVTLWLYLSREGVVRKVQLRRSSGIVAFDDLAQAVARLMQFRPALNQGEPTSVWVAQPIRFDIERSSSDADLAGAVGSDAEEDGPRR